MFVIVTTASSRSLVLHVVGMSGVLFQEWKGTSAVDNNNDIPVIKSSKGASKGKIREIYVHLSPLTLLSPRLLPPLISRPPTACLLSPPQCSHIAISDRPASQPFRQCCVVDRPAVCSN